VIEGYVNAYLDRRMNALIEEWQLATSHDLEDFEGRVTALSDDIERIRSAEDEIGTKLASLEAKAARLEGMIR